MSERRFPARMKSFAGRLFARGSVSVRVTAVLLLCLAGVRRPKNPPAIRWQRSRPAPQTLRQFPVGSARRARILVTVRKSTASHSCATRWAQIKRPCSGSPIHIRPVARRATGLIRPRVVALTARMCRKAPTPIPPMRQHVLPTSTVYSHHPCLIRTIYSILRRSAT